MENLSRSKSVSIPAHAPLYIRDFESDVTETNSRDSHTSPSKQAVKNPLASWRLIVLRCK
jgi:hypothetical protein